MSIIRSPRLESNFSIISNSVIRDSRLSYKARGILLEILSRPDNWSVSADSLARSGQEGRHSILSALKELREAGYLRTEKLRDEKGMFKTISIVYDTPKLGLTEVGLPDLGQPEAGYQESDNLTSLEVLSKKDCKEVLIKKDLEIKDLSPSEIDFEQFWNIYPRPTAKGAARIAFSKALKKASLEKILSGASRLSDDPNLDPAFTPHPSTWLNQERWDDGPLPPRFSFAPSKSEVNAAKGRSLADQLRFEESQQRKEITSERI